MTTGTTPASTAANGRTTAPLRAPVLIPPRARRRPGLMVAGIVLAVVGALGAAWLVASASDRTAVVVLARDVPYGATLTEQDLTVGDVALDPTIESIPAEQLEGLVGQVAGATLVTGSVLAPAQVQPAGPPLAGEVLVPLPLDPARMPAGGLTAGDRLLVVDTPAAQAEPPKDTPVTLEASVARVGAPDLNGVVVVDLVAAAEDGPALAARAATGRFALVILPTGEER
ncbi:SAF domain-containing protein [Cellulomonas sp. NS3]|uniref:SAF domain-containing protein n=1 Tax=Cellulomonas sp. NS3 TaxID=2973977 RepID=UPI002162C1CC|nr:SAF domain-containing protein [Cellulomonas sp. NS3]